jgi:pimeloyl-ACP methyl ester carboxylesterase
VLSAPVTPYLLRTDDNPHGIVDAATVAAARELIGRDVGAWMATYPGFPGSYFGAGHAVSADMLDWTRRQIFDTPVQLLLATFGPFDLRADLVKVSVPTLILHGDADFSAPIDATGRRVAELVPDNELVVFEGAGHGLYSYDPPRYNAELSRFCLG